MKICKLHNLPKHRGNCPACNYLQGQKRMIKEREQIRMAKAAGNGGEEFCRKWNEEHPFHFSVSEAVENFKIYTGRVTA